MYTNNMLGRLQQDSIFMNIFIKNYAAQKGIIKIWAEQDLAHQVLKTANALSFLAPLPLYNRPKFNYVPNYDCFSMGLVNMMKGLSEANGWDNLSTLMAILSATSMSLCGRFNIVIHQNWSEPLNLYTLLIAPSGAQKSALISRIKQPFANFISVLEKEYAQSAPKKKFVAKHVSMSVDALARREMTAAIKDMYGNGNTLASGKISPTLTEMAEQIYEANSQVISSENLAPPDFFISHGTEKGLATALLNQGECLAGCEAEGGFIHQLTKDST